jgi:hypothetical protein
MNRRNAGKQKRTLGNETVPLSPSHRYLLGTPFHDSLQKIRCSLFRFEGKMQKSFCLTLFVNLDHVKAKI